MDGGFFAYNETFFIAGCRGGCVARPAGMGFAPLFP